MMKLASFNAVTRPLVSLSRVVLAPLGKPAKPGKPKVDTFEALHDLVWLHETKTVDGLEARLYEVWASANADDGDPGVRLVLALRAQGEPPVVWDLGIAESALGISSNGPGRLTVSIEPRHDADVVERALDVRYRCEGPLVAATLRVGTRLVNHTRDANAAMVSTVLRVQDAELEHDDFVHARLFERYGSPRFVLQLCDRHGRTLSFDLPDLEVEHMQLDDASRLVIAGFDRSRARVELVARPVAGGLELVPVDEDDALCPESGESRSWS